MNEHDELAIFDRPSAVTVNRDWMPVDIDRDEQAVCHEDDELRHWLADSTVLLDDGEVFTRPAESQASLRGRGRYRYDRVCVDCGDVFVAAREKQIRCNQCSVVDDFA